MGRSYGEVKRMVEHHWVGCYAPAFVGLALGLVAMVRGWKDRGKLQAKEKRLEEITVLVQWWRKGGQGEDFFRGKDSTGPAEVLDAIERVASGGKLNQETNPILFHECGCPVYREDYMFHPEHISPHMPWHGVKWIPPSVSKAYAESRTPPAGHVGGEEEES